MGTHPNGPSSVKIPGQPDKSLEDWLHKNPDALGTRMKDYFKGALPFLFKVLSVNNSLSVQAHPNKVGAISFMDTVNFVLSGHPKIDKTKVLQTNGSLMQVKSIAECSLGAFCNTFDLHKTIIGLEYKFLVFSLSGCLRQVLLYTVCLR